MKPVSPALPSIVTCALVQQDVVKLNIGSFLRRFRTGRQPVQVPGCRMSRQVGKLFDIVDSWGRKLLLAIEICFLSAINSRPKQNPQKFLAQATEGAPKCFCSTSAIVPRRRG